MTAQNKILASLALAMAGWGTEAQTAPDVPRLVVNVIVDQLRSDYLEAFSPLFGEGGFQRLMKEGKAYSQAEYPFDKPDRASSIACLVSGSSPYENGIIGQRWLNRTSLQPTGCVDDSRYEGQFTLEKSSPVNLAVSTLSDELKVATEGRALVYAVAPERDAAVLLAGHAADGAFWMNDETGEWASSTYYAIPHWLSYYNKSYHAARRIGTMMWTPTNSFVGEFNYFVSGGTKNPFRHSFKGERQFREFKASALVNEEVTDFVSHCLQNSMLGGDAVTDVLSVGYYAGNYDHKTAAECPMELQDTYVRLDNQLARLIEMVERKVGLERVLFVLTSTGYSDTEDTDDDLSRYKIPSGEFNIGRAQLLLNMYLSAVYGQAKYVEACMGNQIYLNLKYIADKGLNLGEVLERSADFLIQLDGVRDVYTSQRLAQGAWTPGIRSIRNAYNPKTSGDILIQVAPGWRLVNEQTGERKLQRESYMGFPLYFYGLSLQPEVVETPVTVDRIAPTLARCLRIRAPNACSASPLTGIR